MRADSSKTDYRPLLLVLFLGWIVRWLYVWLMPAEARSSDIFAWGAAGDLLLNGRNPYHDTTILNWPPFWMQWIYILGRISMVTGIEFVQVLRIFLAGVESLVVVVLYRFIRRWAPEARTFVLLLAGIALNPTTIFLTCQHCNFDVMVALWVMLFVERLTQYQESKRVATWLAACFFLGLGILTKTVPLVLCPMLAGGLRRVPWKAKWIGLTLLLGPVTLGMSIIYVLTPEDVATKVLGYRSSPGWFGISGLLQLSHADSLIGPSIILFYILLTAVGVLAGLVFWRNERVAAKEIVLCAALLLALIPALGPGYSPQYLYWFLPLLVASYAFYGGWWRRIVLLFGVVAAATCIVEYAVIASHGSYLFYIVQHNNLVLSEDWAMRLHWLETQPGQTVLRLPLFLAFLALLIVGGRMMIQKVHDPTRDRPECR